MPDDYPTDPRGRAGDAGPRPPRHPGDDAPTEYIERVVPQPRHEAPPTERIERAAPHEPLDDAPPTEYIERVVPQPAIDPSPTEYIQRVPTDVPGPTVGSVAPGGAPEAPPAGTARGSRSAGGHRARRQRHWGRRVLAGILVILLALGVGTYFVLRHLDGNLRSIDVNGLLGTRPSELGKIDPNTNLGPMNILLMGSDTRAGQDANIGDARGVVGARSDVTMIAHLAADRKSATVVSIPRDTMVRGPVGCKLDQPESDWKVQQFNSFFEQGGPPCTMKVVESMTGIYLDHFAVVDFVGFRNIVNALGTVEVCITAPVKDPASGADFKAGRQRLNGDQSLSFVRLRHAGDGSDTSRIKRQQDFLSSVVREATSAGTLANPVKLYSFLDASTKTLTTDTNLKGLADIALSARDMQTKDVRFVSMPWEPYSKDHNRVQAAPAADKVWEVLRTDSPWPGTGKNAPAPSVSASSPAATATVAAVLPNKVEVDVVNASGKEGFGAQTAAALKAQGFVIASTTGQDTVTDGTVIHYAKRDKAKANELAAAFTGATLKADRSAGMPVKVVLGRGAQPVKLVPNAPSGSTLPKQPISPPPSQVNIESKTANQDICTKTE